MKWVLQHKDYGLGNFINLTPTIYRIYSDENTPVKVYFESDYVRDAFSRCEWIEVLEEKPESEPIMCSSWIDKSDMRPDYEFVWGKYGFTGNPSQPIYKPKGLVVFMNGCATDAKRDTKNPGDRIYNYIYERICDKYTVIFVGSKLDFVWYGGFYDGAIIDNIESAISLISKAEFVVSNDTGLYHVSGMLAKKGFIL